MIKKISLLVFLGLALCKGLSAKVVEIPYMQLATGQIVIQAHLSGTTEAQYFIFETAGGNFLRSDMNYRLQELGLDTLESKFKFDNVKIGDLTLTEGTTFKTRSKLGKRSEYAFPPVVIGTIGARLFGNKLVQFDFEKKVILVADEKSELNIPAKTAMVPFTQSFTDYSPMVDVEPWNFNMQQLPVEVSTPVGIVLAWEDVVTEQKIRYQNQMTSYRVALDDEHNIEFHEIISYKVFFYHSFTMYNVPISYSEFFRPMIGYMFLKEFKPTLDFANGKLYLEPVTDKGKAYFEKPKKEKKKEK